MVLFRIEVDDLEKAYQALFRQVCRFAPLSWVRRP